MNCDVIICWPRNCDYPLFRQFVKDNRERFKKFFIIFTETHHGNDYRDFVKEQMKDDDITFLQNPVLTAGQDWRDVAVNMALELSNAEWVWFTEQDFQILNNKFWEDVEEIMKYQSAFGVYEEDRLHPCCIFAKRDYIEGTTKYFGIVPDRIDHFGVFQKDLQALTDVINIPEGSYHHMAGLSHNMRLLSEGGMPNHNIEDFERYVRQCMQLMLLLPHDYTSMFNKFLGGISHREKSA